MAHNKLRRDLSELIDWVNDASPRISAMSGEQTSTHFRNVITRALTELGGPVENTRPPVVTLASDTVSPQADGDNTPLVGRDLGDETADEVSGLGEHREIMDAVEPLVSGDGLTEDAHHG